jgi:hypothetical protein
MSSIQISDHIALRPLSENELEIRSDFPNYVSLRYQFENTDTMNEFCAKLKKTNKTHQRLMQGILMEISMNKIPSKKYTFKSCKERQKYFWFSPDLSEIRWASSKDSKKYRKSKVVQRV